MKATIELNFNPAEYGVDEKDKEAVKLLIYEMMNGLADWPGSVLDNKVTVE